MDPMREGSAIAKITVIFNNARDEKKTGGKPDSPGKADVPIRNSMDSGKPPSVSCSSLLPSLLLFSFP
ncbi:hypothetical protein SAY87_002926 [Trapa incisa]|uniref:Uncharacterized protein n=1 Tax=Trapa incisa TaxID=236973 RepID=A0AAN7KQJ5_9MYRT|nr:hypothetical protein SAY87_002926 [Trapa incisa]